jgi:SAM-dependent methyltransferase
MNTISINSNNKILNISVTDLNLYRKYTLYQRHGVIRTDDSASSRLNITKESNVGVEQDIATFYTTYWDTLLSLGYYTNLPVDPIILDIGSGIGILDILAYQYLDNRGTFYLLDKGSHTFTGSDYSHTHGFYHNWDVTRDIIKTTNCNEDSFIFLNPNSKWPDKIDLITSSVSWCWHYPFNTYWNKVKTHLAIGGKLALEISNSAEADSNIIETISKEFNSVPVITNMRDLGYRCVWIRAE